MLGGLLIIACSLVMLLYWFRYSCILILRNRAEQKQIAPVTSGRFSFAGVQERLLTGGELDPLQRELARDYKILTYLLEHAAGLELGSFEDRLLVLDYHVMGFIYRLTRTAAPQQARQALTEMATVLGVLVNRIGEHVGAESEA